MATLTSRQPPAPVQQLTPPSSSHGVGGSWDFAVPVTDPKTDYHQDPYMSEYVTSAHVTQTQHKGFGPPIHSTSWKLQETQQYTMEPERGYGVRKKASGDIRANSIEKDGIQEYYKSHANGRKGPSTVKAKPRKKPARSSSADPNTSQLEQDHNNWIHRDKLKEIETRELEEAGFRVGRSSRSNSRSQSATRRPRAHTNSESTELTQMEDRADRRVVSPIPAEDEEQVEEYQTWSPMSDGQAMQEFQPASPRANHSGRPSTSRIPLPKSGIPVPASSVDRDTTSSRSRTSSLNWNGEAMGANGARMRSGSVGSQVLLDDTTDGRQTTPPYAGHKHNRSTGSVSPQSPQRSPVKAKTAAKATPAATNRKTSATKTAPKRGPSNASPPKRPGTSGGGVARPMTSNRPEGEAPWIKTMYKPDPRLPPDQQIIPTHAKRMQQEQWENEGRVGSMYDKDFRLLSDESPDKRLSLIQPIDFAKAQEEGAWPLPSPAKQDQVSLEKVDSRTARSPVNEQGAYKLTPTIPQGSRAASPKLAPAIDPPATRPTTTRVPEPIEEAKEKKGCGCIVM